MAKSTNQKGIIKQGIGAALVKSVKQAPAEYKQFFLSKRFSRENHSDALYYLLNLYITELEKEKYSIVKIQKLLYFIFLSLTEYCKEPNITIELYTDLKKIKTLYTEFKNKNEKYNNDMIDDIVDLIDDTLISMRPELTSEDISLAQKMKEKVDELNGIIDDKDKEIERLIKEFNNYTKAVKKDNNYEEKYKNKKKEVELLIENQDKEKKELNKIVTDKDKEIEDLKETILNLENEIKEEEKRKNNIDNKIIRDNNIIDIIINELNKRDLSHNKLLDIINNKGYFINNNELHELLKKAIIKVKKDRFSNGNIIYSINKAYDTNKSVNLNTSLTTNLLIISDIDITLNSINQYILIEKIYNYCLNNNIDYIFILGNIISITDNSLNLNTIKDIEKILKEITINYPQDDRITNFFMGGKEKYLTNIGYDFINRLSETRYDFNNLGYTDSSISVNNVSNTINLHNTNDNIDEHISNYYYNNKLNNPTSLDFINTNSEGIIDLTNRIIAIPPLMSNDKGCSIYQVEITVNDDFIKKYNIFPIMNDDLIPTSKIIIYK